MGLNKQARRTRPRGYGLDASCVVLDLLRAPSYAENIDDATVVRFARGGSRDGVELSKEREYHVSVDDGPWEQFRSPWDQAELDAIVKVLRNDDPEQKPAIDTLNAMGATLGAAIAGAPSLATRLQAAAGHRLVVFWQLDFPELARLPWELASWWVPPNRHILLEPNISFVRTIPLYHPSAPTQWPTGSDRTLRVLFVWGETQGATVPHAEHIAGLERVCSELDVELISQEITRAADLTALMADGAFDFVHCLAHGVAIGDEWGLRLADEDVTGEQMARALTSADVPPAMVTLAACDSANELDASFGSVAYQLHAHGIPMVLGSQFRLRKRVSTVSSAQVYEAVLSGRHPLDVLSTLRRQLAPNNNEAWSNEVLYLNYSLPALDGGASIARQQAALRAARVIARRHEEIPSEVNAAQAITDLDLEIDSLRQLAEAGFDPPETFGLLGSLTRRVAHIRSDPPDVEELRDARDFYERGLRADANSLYCGINAVNSERGHR